MKPVREAKFRKVIKARQPDLTVILENVHDIHNISAVLRSADSVGIQEVFVLYTEEHLTPERIEMGKRSSKGTRKWVDVWLFNDVDACMAAVKKKYKRILGTHLGESAVSIHATDFTIPTAILLGNERDGISSHCLPYLDGNIVIPQMGMAESLNISVACAVTLYEALRQRNEKGYYNTAPKMTEAQQADMMADFVFRHEDEFFDGYLRAGHEFK